MSLMVFVAANLANLFTLDLTGDGEEFSITRSIETVQNDKSS